MFLIGCTTQVVQPVTNLINRDLESFVDLAQRFGTDGERRCAAFIHGAWVGQNEIASFDANGILANAYKARLLQRTITENEDLFKSECGEMAVDIMILIGRSAPFSIN